MAMNIGEKIRTLRKAKGVSQEALARHLDVTFQSVSKWETGTTTPDISLLPPLASYFGVSIDELFDYHAWENEQIIEEICRRAYRVRSNDPISAEKILNEGLKQYPGNEKLLTVLVYTLWAIPERDEDLISACKALIACATDMGVKYDTYRFLAMAHHRNGNNDMVQQVLAQIPEFYFTKLECMAKLTTGPSSLNAAQLQMNLSGCCLIEMLQIMSDRYRETGDHTNATKCLRISEGVRTLFRQEGGRDLEITGYAWIDI